MSAETPLTPSHGLPRGSMGMLGFKRPFACAPGVGDRGTSAGAAEPGSRVLVARW